MHRKLGDSPHQDRIEDAPSDAQRRNILPIEREAGELTIWPNRDEAVNHWQRQPAAPTTGKREGFMQARMITDVADSRRLA